jgi:hypothetical protein
MPVENTTVSLDDFMERYPDNLIGACINCLTPGHNLPGELSRVKWGFTVTTVTHPISMSNIHSHNTIWKTL